MHTKKNAQNHQIAIIGMGCIFPKSRDLKEYWNLLLNGIDAIEDIPEDTHWKLKDYFDEDPATPDHTYCTRGGFIPKIAFDPLSYGIPPNNLEATDTAQLLGLEVARMALADAGYHLNHPVLEEKKVNVILGVTGTQELVIPLGARLGHPIWKKALEDSGIDGAKQDEVLQRIQGDYVQWQENSFPGLLGNVVAGRIANRLNLSGTNTVTDSACASSLSAVHTAVMELITGKCDISITGGADALNDIFMHMCFSKTGVLSHTSDAKPFSKDADGTVLGEGIGMLVLKRLEDAQKDNDRIYAVIKGIGTSSDGKTSAIYAPDAKGQLKALSQAYQDAGIAPETVRLIEAHGTGTRVGDKVEFDALKQCFPEGAQKNRTAIGSVKSMIGHTKAAAGAAGIIKSALALHNKVIPPTLKATKPDPELDINNSAFYLNASPKPWVSDNGTPRRSGVSAFGFGGSNFHAVLEEYKPSKSHTSWDGSVQIMAFSSDSKKAIRKQIQAGKEAIEKAGDAQEESSIIAWQAFESRKNFVSGHRFRLLISHNRYQDIQENLDKGLSVLENEKSSANIYFGSGDKKGRLGFLFPGQGSQYTGMGKELCAVFPEALEVLEHATDVFSKKRGDDQKSELQDFIFPPPVHIRSKSESESLLRQTDIAQPAIAALSLAMAKVIERFKITPDVTCGHSFGELSALCSAGWIDAPSFLELAIARGKHMAAASRKDGDSGSMLAVKAPLEEIETLIKDEGLNLILANRNSRTQGVLSGPTDQIKKAGKLCRKKGLTAVKLPVAAAFHSEFVQEAAKPFKKDLSAKTFTPTPVDVLSNATGTTYPKDKTQIKNTLGGQLISPVNFIDNLEQMVEKGVTTFLEIGPKSVLTGLARSVLKSNDITAIPLDGSAGKKSGIGDLAKALCLLSAEGFDVDLTQWEEPAEKPVPRKMVVKLSGANPKPSTRCELPKSDPSSSQADQQQPCCQKTDASLPANSAKSNTSDAVQAQDAATSNKNRQAIKGSAMTPNHRIQHPHTESNRISEAMQMVQKGLEAMQQLQTQTAKAHEKFLETQAQATRALAGMMDQTRGVAFGSPVQTSAAPVDTQPQSAPVKEVGRSAPVQEKAFSQVPPPEPVLEPETQIQPSQPQANLQQETALKSETVEPSTSGTPVEPVLFDIVSQLTGFPVEMLEPGMDIESDLGIDSIKKVEIISELEKQIPDCQGLTPENIGSVRTLKDICLAITDQTGSAEPSLQAVSEASPADSALETENNSTGQARKEIETALFNTISELTGFPVEMLELSMNLESDLGIDSIKRVEILSKLEQQLDHIDTIESEDVAGLKTIEEIVSRLDNTIPGQADSDNKKKTPESEITHEKEVNSEESDKELTCQVVELKEYPTNQIRFYNGAKIEPPENRKVYITKDRSNIALQFQKEFIKAGISTELIEITTQETPELPDAAGLVILPDAFAPKSLEDPADFLKAAFLLVKKNAGFLMESGKVCGGFLATISFLGGGFGFGQKPLLTNPVYGGLAGLAKTADIELKNVLCRALDMPADPEACISNAEAAVALMMTQGNVEMGLDGESCNIPSLVDQKDSGTATVGKEILSQNDVIVVTGGAKGVTAACAIEIAEQFSPTIILIGRSPAPAPEPSWAKGIEDAATLKKAILDNAFSDQTPKPAELEKRYKIILSNREIIQNIARMEQKGSAVKYFACDITDAPSVDNIFQEIRKAFGPVTTLIHGAGVLKDKLIVDKTPEQFSTVFNTKIQGLDALLSAAKKDHLKYCILFSSVAARSGNQGQSDYAMANEVLNKTAQKLSRDFSTCRFLSVNWGPWEGGMVSASLKKEFTRRGIDLIPLKSGAKQLVRQMSRSEANDPEVVIGAQLIEKKKKKSSKLSKAVTTDFGLAALPVLSAHKIGDKAVVPFALLIESHAHAAEISNPGLIVSGFDDMRLLKGVKPDAARLDLQVNLGKCLPCANSFETASSITTRTEDGRTHTHTGCTMILKESLPKPPVLSQAAFMELKPYPMSAQKAYEKVLFHGPEMQCIQSINGYSSKGIEVLTTLAPEPGEWMKKPFRSKWAIDPLMMDAAFQAAILWTHERLGQVCLPSYIANLRLYNSFKNLDGDVRILFTVNEESKNRIKGYFTFLDDNNTVVASITGFEAVTDPSLNEKFKNKPLFSRSSILAFAEGNPSEAFGEQYKIFDNDRQIARLPRPPYFFMDRVLNADHKQWQMKPGGWIEAQYDIPADEWYFKANHTRTMPFAVLLEIALQPCGWLAAYAGSALESEERLYFRNLGGKAELHNEVQQGSGTLTMRSRIKEVSKAGGMIIQDFDFEVLCNGAAAYTGTTNFGFFSGKALANQVGIRNSKLGAYQLNEKEIKSAFSYEFIEDSPLTPDDTSCGSNLGMPSKALRMIDRIDAMTLTGGIYDNGYIKAVKEVDPSEWFFKAHFYQDPVCPGSLGVESFLQMLRFFLLNKFEISPELYEVGISPGASHEWTYRGQIIPENKNIEIHAHIKSVNRKEGNYSVSADGALVVDEICIYEMKDFGVEFKLVGEQKPISKENSL